MPTLIETVSEFSVLLGVVCAVACGVDLFRRPQPMWIMNVIWPITCLYAGPIALGFYAMLSRTPRSGEPHGEQQSAKPLWRSALMGAAHCGAGCALGDLAGDTVVSGLALRILGSALLAKLLCAFTFAYALGIFFQFFAIAPMRHLDVRAGIVAAIKADTASLIAFEVGMFAWIVIAQTWLYPVFDRIDGRTGR